MATNREPGFGGSKGRVRTPRVASDDEMGSIAETLRTVPARSRKARAASRSRKSTPRAVRESRVQGQRAAREEHPETDAPWAPPTSLEAPPPREGYRQKWVRVAIFGRDDVQNVSRKFREGWLPRPVESVPKSFHVPTIRNGQFAGCIGVEGSILCEMPEKKARQRNDHYRRRAQQMAEDIERNISNINRSIPRHNGFGRIEKVERSVRVRPRAEDVGGDDEEL